MKNSIFLLCSLSGLILCIQSFSQDTDSSFIQLKEATLENKQSFACWRVDYYICTGIAYAKSMGQSVDDFAEFVGNRHNLGNPNTATLKSVIQTGHYVITSYPGGEFEVISESDSIIVAKSNRPYKDYFKEGPLIGVTLEEFEKYFWSHVAIMHSKLNIDFKYEISGNEVIQTISYSR
jgi:hypothetical protein